MTFDVLGTSHYNANIQGLKNIGDKYDNLIFTGPKTDVYTN